MLSHEEVRSKYNCWYIFIKEGFLRVRKRVCRGFMQARLLQVYRRRWSINDAGNVQRKVFVWAGMWFGLRVLVVSSFKMRLASFLMRGITTTTLIIVSVLRGLTLKFSPFAAHLFASSFAYGAWAFIITCSMQLLAIDTCHRCTSLALGAIFQPTSK